MSIATQYRGTHNPKICVCVDQIWLIWYAPQNH